MALTDRSLADLQADARAIRDAAHGNRVTSNYDGDVGIRGPHPRRDLLDNRSEPGE